MKVFKRDRIFMEQLVYPEQSQEERFLVGLRRGWWPFWVGDTYLYQVQVTEAGVKTYWGVEQRRLWGDTDVEAVRKRLVGALITDYPLEVDAFQVVKTLPQWPLSAERTLALELAENPAKFETGARVESRHYPLVTSLAVSGQENGKYHHKRMDTLLAIIQDVIQGARAIAMPLVLQVIFKPVWAGSTRQVKRKRRAGDQWVEDPYRMFREQLKIIERTRGKTVGYWQVTVRILAPRELGELWSGVNRGFAFRKVNARRAIQRYHRQAFGRRVRMSAIPLRRLVQVPTGDLFPRERLGARTMGEGTYGRWQTQPFPRDGYILGRDEGREDICIDDGMLRAHLLITGQTGCRKSSLMRFLGCELAQNPQNRLFILDYAGEYLQLMDHMELVLFRPGSEDFPLGINFLDWTRTLGVDEWTAESWILRVLETLIRGRSGGGAEFTPKMEAMLRDMIRHELRREGTLFDLLEALKSLRTRIRKTKGVLTKKQQRGTTLTDAEELLLADYGAHDLTIEAIQNRLLDLYGSPLRRVFFVHQTTVRIKELLERHVILDLSALRRQGLRNDLLRLFCEFVLLYLSRGVTMREKGRVTRRNIVVLEEAQQLVPEVLAKRTLADGTTPEELIGTLGGFGMSLIFVTAQPALLSRTILNGCHTKVVFSLQGREAALLAEPLGVDPREVARLQVGECFIRAAGTGVCKVTARTWPSYPDGEKALLQWYHRKFPPDVLQHAHARYQFLEETPLEYYSTLVEVIEGTSVASAKEPDESTPAAPEEQVGCWAEADCGLCVKDQRLVARGMTYADAYWKKTTKEALLAKLKMYHLIPTIVYEDLRTLVHKQHEPNAELVAFCAHWRLFDRCTNHPTLGKRMAEVAHASPKQLVTLLVGFPEISRVLDRGKKLLQDNLVKMPPFSPWDSFCDLCPLEQGLRKDFCTRYREEANLALEDPDRWHQLTVAYRSAFPRFLERCYAPVLAGTSTNASFCYCLATTFLKGAVLTKAQQAILQDQIRQFLLTLETNAEEPGPLESEPAAGTINAHQMEKKVRNSRSSQQDGKIAPDPTATHPGEGEAADVIKIPEIFAQQGGVVSRRELQQWLHLQGTWTSEAAFYELVDTHLGLKKFHVALPWRNPMNTKAVPETFYIAPDRLGNEAYPLNVIIVMHDFILQAVKTQVGRIGVISDGSRRTLEDGRTQVSDLVVTCGTLTTVIEFTTGDKASLRHVIQKLADRPRKEKTVLLVGLEKPARGQPSTTRVCVRSAKQDALEIAKAYGIELEVFTLTRIEELLAYCQNRTRTYSHRRS